MHRSREETPNREVVFSGSFGGGKEARINRFSATIEQFITSGSGAPQPATASPPVSPSQFEMEKKSKKSKNKTSDLADVGDGSSHVEIDVGLPKKNGHNRREKKKKSKSNEDGNNNNDGCLQKKRKRDSFEKAQLKENEQGQDDEPVVDRNCEPKSRKEKKKKHKHLSQEREEGEKEVSASEDGYQVNGESNTRSALKTSNKEDGEGSKSKKMTKSTEKNSEKPKAKAKSKRVSFSGHVEVFPLDAEKQKTKGDGLVRGKRFTPEEDTIIKEAVHNYIIARDLGDEGLKIILNCMSHPGMKKCWQEIATCIPYRPHLAVYNRAHILFERSEKRSWTPEEIEFLKEFHEKNGNKWKMAAQELGKHRFHVKDAWRRIKLKDLKGGRWTQEEYQSLYDLVNLDLQMKVTAQEKKSKHGMLRDNIPWTAISEKLSTRSDATCCQKWYDQLTSSLVAEKKWSDADDYRLIGALYDLDAACVEDVDWDSLLEHRPGDICRKRWNQMVLHIGYQGSKPFAEQVDTLAKRYCPDLAEIREAWDNKPVIP